MEVLDQEKTFYEGSGFRSPRLDHESGSPFGITGYYQATRTLDSARSDYSVSVADVVAEQPPRMSTP